MKIPNYNKKTKHPTYLEMQEEIERLKQDNEYLNKVNIELSSRNQKVISMLLRSEIPLNDYLIRDIQNDTYYYLKTIIDILKGVDK